MSFTIFQNKKTPFKGLKTRSSKSRQIDIFPKGVNQWLCSKNGYFSNCFFLGNIRQENVFYDILEQKDAFLGYKNKKSKKSKNCHFWKGVNPWFRSKNCHISNFPFRQYSLGKCLLRYSRTKKKPFQAIKTRSPKSSKNDILGKGLTHGFGPDMAIFPTSFQAKQARKMSFIIFQNKQTPFQGLKTKSSKSRKTDIFSKGLTHGSGPKIAIFPTFFLGNVVQENVFYDILERTKAFLGYKNKKFKESKN